MHIMKKLCRDFEHFYTKINISLDFILPSKKLLKYLHMHLSIKLGKWSDIESVIYEMASIFLEKNDRFNS